MGALDAIKNFFTIGDNVTDDGQLVMKNKIETLFKQNKISKDQVTKYCATHLKNTTLDTLGMGMSRKAVGANGNTSLDTLNMSPINSINLAKMGAGNGFVQPIASYRQRYNQFPLPQQQYRQMGGKKRYTSGRNRYKKYEKYLSGDAQQQTGGGCTNTSDSADQLADFSEFNKIRSSMNGNNQNQLGGGSCFVPKQLNLMDLMENSFQQRQQQLGGGVANHFVPKQVNLMDLMESNFKQRQQLGGAKAVATAVDDEFSATSPDNDVVDDSPNSPVSVSSAQSTESSESDNSTVEDIKPFYSSDSSEEETFRHPYDE